MRLYSENGRWRCQNCANAWAVRLELRQPIRLLPGLWRQRQPRSKPVRRQAAAVVAVADAVAGAERVTLAVLAAVAHQVANLRVVDVVRQAHPGLPYRVALRRRLRAGASRMLRCGQQQHRTARSLKLSLKQPRLRHLRLKPPARRHRSKQACPRRLMRTRATRRFW
jgi:hypothetical protein